MSDRLQIIISNLGAEILHSNKEYGTSLLVAVIKEMLGTYSEDEQERIIRAALTRMDRSDSYIKEFMI